MIGLRQLAQAETNVNVSSNTSGSSNTRVVVNSNVTTSNVTTTNSNSRTTVHIENNGEVKDFDTNGDESVDWQSSDGKSSVKINNNGSGIKSATTVTPEEKSQNIDNEKDKEEDERIATSSVESTFEPKKTTKAGHSIIQLFLTWLQAFFK